MPFQTHRPSQTLLIPKKRPLLEPTKTKVKAVQHQTFNNSPTTTTKPGEQEKEGQTQPTEYDFARIPQPFLDPRLWENIKVVDSLVTSSSTTTSSSTAASSGGGAAATGAATGGARVSNREKSATNEKEAEEEDRKKSLREAEYGRMAVRGRTGVRRGYR
ncbi:hypothetical protein P168DRAFT_325337 [Aspergillus campestris IBT 28561]|uniref:Uncharacterized protein n=1 Tax=Aspergillus campestris (strain IBT 28561) TaxID=1392248 RepID=A0A2I1D9B3_ASPC2|nr:uncharacterized protein P168DRAFT_325337 [Aspergillus campestris IBT 28561]PKY06472.1 hypothetical protein P168DRAFT_325337 [Aspergillus campestris IBT 28561]